jgi:hypothetical protein
VKPTPAITDQPQNVEDCLIDGEPDWERIDFDVPCSRCGYELRMLTVARCPECGLTFAWPDVLYASVRRTMFLFEYRWRDRPVRSWLETLWRGLRPWRFWSEVSLHEHIRPGPLLFLFLTAPLVLMLAYHGGAGIVALLTWLAVFPLLPYQSGPSLMAVSEEFQVIAMLPYRVGSEYAIVPLGVLLVMLGMLGLICMLQQTLGRCRVRIVQVLRVMAYSVGPLCVLVAAAALIGSFLDAVGLMYAIPGLEVLLSIVFPIMLSIGIPGLFLAYGLGRYLRLPRAWLIGPVAALVGWLFMITAMTIILRSL